MSRSNQLRQAIELEDLDRVKILLSADPNLHRGQSQDGDDGPLCWVAECPPSCATPSSTRIAMAEWLITHGSDVHQGGNGPLFRAAHARCIPIMETLVAHGANVNGLWRGWFPILFVPCENLDSVAMQWLLDHGADTHPRCPTNPCTALDYVTDSYVRDPTRLRACIEVLLGATARTRYDLPGVLPILRARNDELVALIDADPSLVHRRYEELVCGASGGRMLTLRGTTLLHVAAEFGCFDAARLLLNRGADVNARASLDANGVGGHTPIFHALTHSQCVIPELGQLLIGRGADMTIRARVPGHYERPGELLDVSAAEYAALFPLR